ncbi:hypothetical protein LAV73_09230 [Lysinibacillus xylanilyticus]|uniref:hypothetical protein n=1 Tax=Lysinibacillus xylanilyticus TaxID=582475 RepID=UPI002B242818|nr:hypothetical protein [Lysinibacillus xylanilyticus]MEB2280178.1 hypothetical protein [Lysinibacillus xylanilyticus]
MDTLPSKNKVLLKIYIKSFSILMLFVSSAVATYFLKQSNNITAYYIVFVLGIICLHKLINRAMLRLIRFNQVKAAILKEEATYQDLTAKECLLNSIFLAPVTIIISIVIYSANNIVIQILMFVLILTFLIIGETAKYRFSLYKNWYDENLI